MKQTVIGIYDNADNARKAEKELIRDGFDKNTVDIADNSGREDARERNRGFFGSLFGNSDDANRHAEVAERGTVVTVHTQNMRDAERAAAILDKFGTIDINPNDAGSRHTNTGATSATGRTTDTTGRTSDMTAKTGDMKVPIIEEQLNVGKREVETGGARLRSRIVERPVEEHLRLREEHVNIDRNPVNRKATDADLKNFKEGSIDATAHAEVPIVNKEARVVEEVNIHKDVTSHDETVRDTVRKTDVDVDKVKNKDTRDTKY
jgi:uncharacterized protein (TIGR02271 family)